MKTPLYITLITLFYSITSCAQTKFKEGTVIGKNERFEVSTSNLSPETDKTWFVNSKKNKYNGNLPPARDNWALEIAKKDIHFDHELIRNIIYNVLKNKREALHQQKQSIGMVFIFETNGTLVNTSYSFKEKAGITPAEIEQIDNEIRKNIKATFTGPSYKHYDAVYYYAPFVWF